MLVARAVLSGEFVSVVEARDPDATAGASTAVASGSGSVVRRTSTSTKIEM